MALTISEALAKGTKKLNEAAIKSAPLDTAILLAKAIWLDRLALITEPHRALTKEQEDTFNSYIERRFNHEPIAYIIGEREFWSRPFKTTEKVLIPRPDSETLIATLLMLLPDKDVQAKIADLGVGSGCLILTMLAECPNLHGFGVDISDVALKLTAENAVNLGVADRLDLIKPPADKPWADALPEEVSIIISNPPYIPTADIKTLMEDVKNYEPMTALDGGKDGLDAYRALIPTAHNKLHEGGLLLLEIGIGQAEDVKSLLKPSHWSETSVYNDLSGIPRVIAAVKKE